MRTEDSEIVEMPDGYLILVCPLCGKPIESGISRNDVVEGLDFHVDDDHRDWQRVGYLHYEKVDRRG